jgi:hypothetical protein
MICHIVLIRLGDEARTSWILDKARTLLGPIPVVKNLRVGRGLESDYRHPIALVMDFEDEAALAAYQVHPEHARFRDEILAPIASDKTVLDYEI